MKKVILNLVKNENGNYHTVFKSRHARKIYLAFSVSGDLCTVTECRYLDRSIIKIPKAITFAPFAIETLGEKISKELDATFSEIRFAEKEMMTEEALIARFLGKEKKKILLMLREGETLRTVFRNKTHRSIYLELRLNHGQALIFDCHYADERSRGVPYGLATIRFPFSMKALQRFYSFKQRERGWLKCFDFAFESAPSVRCDNIMTTRVLACSMNTSIRKLQVRYSV